MNYKIVEITEGQLKGQYAHPILGLLPEWFGIPEAVKEYVDTVPDYPFWAAFDREECIGFISLKTHFNKTGEIYVCGVVPGFQHKGVGKALIYEVEKYCQKANCDYIIVKTLSASVNYEPYERTRQFYRSVGFIELVTLTEIWDEENPCLIMLKDLKGR